MFETIMKVELGTLKGALKPDVDVIQRRTTTNQRKIPKDKKEEKILLYCTGGIRCEKTSSYLKHHGFSRCKSLRGGIIGILC